jgi:hypothetical protein
MTGGTGAAHLIPRALAGDEAEQAQDVRPRGHGADFGELDAGYGMAAFLWAESPGIETGARRPGALG